MSDTHQIPEHGAYFLSVSQKGENPAHACTTLYLMDRSDGMVLHAQTHYKNSVLLPGWLQSFEPDINWFGQRKITPVTELQAQEIIAREGAYDQLLGLAKEFLMPTAYMINDALAGTNPSIDQACTLKIAKLARAVPLFTEKLNGLAITHISSAGDLIFGTRYGLSMYCYLEVPAFNLAQFVRKVEEVGFSEKPETYLTKVGNKAKLRDDTTTFGYRAKTEGIEP